MIRRSVKTNWIRGILWVLGGLVLLVIVALAIGYVANGGEYQVAKTVADDERLPFIEINGYRFHGETFGDKHHQTVVVLHGGPGGDYRSIRHLKALSDEYFVVFYDQRGSGLSPRVKAEEITVERFVADLHDIVTRFGHGRKFHLIGHSWGAQLAAAYIGAHPSTVDKTVLGEPGFLTTPLARQYFERTNNMKPNNFGPKTILALANIWFKSLHVDGPDSHSGQDYFMRGVINADMEGHPIAGYFCRRDMKTAEMSDWRFGSLVSQTLIAGVRNENGEVAFDLTAGLDKFDGGVLFVVGGCDTIIGEDVQKQHAELFEHARIEVIEDAGHTMFGEKPKETLRLIRRFLAEPTVQ